MNIEKIKELLKEVLDDSAVLEQQSLIEEQGNLIRELNAQIKEQRQRLENQAQTISTLMGEVKEQNTTEIRNLMDLLRKQKEQTSYLH